MLPFSGLVAVLFINFIFGGSYIFGKLGVNHFPPYLFASLRFLFVLVALAPFLRINKEVIIHWKPIISFCLMMGAGVYGLGYWALYFSKGASLVLVATQFSTPMAVFLGVLFLREKVTKVAWFGITVAMFGVFIVGYDSTLLGQPTAFLLALVSAFFYAAASIVYRGMRNLNINVLNLNSLMALFSFPFLLFLSWFTGEPWLEPILVSDKTDWIAVLYTSLVVSLIGHIGMFALLKRYSIIAIMPFYIFTPIFGVIGSVLFLSEDLTLRFIVGAILAISGVLLINLYSHRSKK